MHKLVFTEFQVPRKLMKGQIKNHIVRKDFHNHIFNEGGPLKVKYFKDVYQRI
jgi:hypothetical protein